MEVLESGVPRPRQVRYQIARVLGTLCGAADDRAPKS